MDEHAAIDGTETASRFFNDFAGQFLPPNFPNLSLPQFDFFFNVRGIENNTEYYEYFLLANSCALAIR
jgi:hypothetical protein